MSSDLTSIELFAGGGGMALGMRLAGFKHTALIEWQASAAGILRHNGARFPDLWGQEEVLQQDVRLWTKAAEYREVHMVAGGPPCQPFSLAGVHAGDDDERNMFPAAVEVLRKFRPQVAVFENVPGLLRPSFAPYFAYIKDQLSKPTVVPKRAELWADHHRRIAKANPRGLRYEVYEHHVDAADFGLPQNRRRVFLVAIRTDVTGSKTWSPPSGTHSREALIHDQWVTGTYWSLHNLKRPEAPADLLSRISEVRAEGRPDGEAWRTIRDAISDLPAPVHGSDHPEVANHRGIDGARAYKNHSGSPFDLPAKTIKAGVHGVSGGEAMIRFSDQSLRYLTVRESARIQGFPDDYEFPTSRSRMMGAIGNAVAAPVAERFARQLIDHCALRVPLASPTPSLVPGFRLENIFGPPQRDVSNNADTVSP